ncbi:hypothetical protein [Streptomyces sp. NPDC055299]
MDHLRAVHAETEDNRLAVLIPEMQLPHVWLRLLRNQCGPVLDRAIRRYTTRWSGACDSASTSALSKVHSAWFSPAVSDVVGEDRKGNTEGGCHDR